MQLLELTQDSQRFVWRNSSSIANSPFQAYKSAPIFSPLNSLIRKAFIKEEPQWLQITPQTLRGHNHWTRSVAFSPDGRYLASGSENKTINIWIATTGKEQPSPQSLFGSLILSVTFSADGRDIAVGLEKNIVMIWNVATGENQRTLRGHIRSVTSVAFSPGNNFLVSGSEDKTITIWNTTTGIERQTIQGHRFPVTSVTFSPDGRYIASGSEDQIIKLWNAMTGEEHKTLQSHSYSVTSVSFLADSNCLASGSKDKAIKVWDIAAGKSQQTLRGHSRAVTSIAFSENGYLASGSDDETIKIWDMTGKELQTLQGHGHVVSVVSSVAFSLDDRYLASGSKDKTIKIWDIATGKEQQTLEIGTELWTISFDNTTSYLHTEINLIKLSIEHYNEVQSMTAAQVLSLDRLRVRINANSSPIMLKRRLVLDGA